MFLNAHLELKMPKLIRTIILLVVAGGVAVSLSSERQIVDAQVATVTSEERAMLMPIHRLSMAWQKPTRLSLQRK